MEKMKRWQIMGAVFLACASISLSAQSCRADAGPGLRNGLPPTSMDSFVYEAGEYAESIYGDESLPGGPPPYMEFDAPHRINAGIVDRRDQGLTTGHGSVMPDGWGRDEFLGLETSQSGARGITTANMDTVDGMPTKTSSAYDDPAYASQMQADMKAAYERDFPTGWVSTGESWKDKDGNIDFQDGTVLIESDKSGYPRGTVIAPQGYQ